MIKASLVTLEWLGASQLTLRFFQTGEDLDVCLRAFAVEHSFYYLELRWKVPI